MIYAKKLTLIAVIASFLCSINAFEEQGSAPEAESKNDEIVFEAVVVAANDDEAFMDSGKYTPKNFLPPLGDYTVLERPVTFNGKSYRILIKYKTAEREIAKTIARQIGEGFVATPPITAPAEAATPDATKKAPAVAPAKNPNEITTVLEIKGVCSSVQPFRIGTAQNLLKDAKIMQTPMGASFQVPGKTKMCSLIYTANAQTSGPEFTHLGKEFYFMTQHTIEELLKDMPGLPAA